MGILSSLNKNTGMRKIVEKKEAISKRRNHSFKRSGIKSSKKNSFRTIEDSPNLSTLEELAISGTSKAYEKAILVTDEIIEVRNGLLIKEKKGKYCKVISNLNYREVQKGLSFVIPEE